MGDSQYSLNRVDDLEIGRVDELCCPNCGFEYTHHLKTAVHEAGGEESAVTVDWTLETEEVQTENPSPRRDAISMFFKCESCPLISAVRFIQHKGKTYIGTDVLNEIDPSWKEHLKERDNPLDPEFYAVEDVTLVDTGVEFSLKD